MKQNEKQQILHPQKPNGIYRYDFPEINGIRQYVQLRGSDRRNPLLLFVHGGPGSSLAGLCHIVQAGWEERFTVANWDQRNACKTRFANRGREKEIAQTGTMEDFIRDLDGVIAYLHTVYDFEKLILVGFSWGSAMSAEYAGRHPENLLCYVGVGQLIQYREGVVCSCEKLLSCMPENSADAKKIHRLLDELPEKLVWDRALFQIMRHFMPLCGRYIMKHAKRVTMRDVFRSPFMSFREKMTFVVPDSSLYTKAFETMLEYDFRRDPHFEVPVLFVSGEEETICPAELIASCETAITAPVKSIQVIPEATHMCFFDAPEAFARILDAFLEGLALSH